MTSPMTLFNNLTFAIIRKNKKIYPLSILLIVCRPNQQRLTLTLFFKILIQALKSLSIDHTWDRRIIWHVWTHNICKRWVWPPWSPIDLFLWNSTRQLEWNSSAMLLQQLKLVMLSNLRLLLINITKILTMNDNFDALVMCILPFMLYTLYSHLNIQILWKITSIRRMLC